jgi:hypothetical protein
MHEQWEVTRFRLDEWLSTELFHLNWWILLAVFILSAVAWWKATA